MVMDEGRRNMALHLRQMLADVDRRYRAARTPDERLKATNQRNALLEKARQVMGKKTGKEAEAGMREIRKSGGKERKRA